jgi:hypothetical protein
MNIFERAARGKYRFSSGKGQLTVEQLFDLPLQGGQANLDDIAIALDRTLEEAAPRSFVSQTSADSQRSELEAKLDIVKHVIASKLAAQAAAETRAAKAEKRRRILEVLDRKDNEALEGKSRDELIAELEALD